MKHIYKIFLITSVLAVLGQYLFAVNGVLSGAGTDASPYLVEDYADLKKVGTTATYTKAKVYRLKNDIDASLSKTELSGAGFTPIGAALATAFTGKFHGAGYTIKKLNVNRATTNNVGLFGYLTGTVDSLKMDSCKIVGKQYVGTVVGFTNTTAVVDACVTLADTVQAVVSYTGGIVGYSLKGIIKNCQNNAVVISPYGIGGILGYANTATSITNCINYASISSTGYSVGGIAGYFSGGNIDSCANLGSIHANYHVGGLVGNLVSSTLNSSYNKGAITADSINVAGCVGLASAVVLDSVYNTAQILGKQTAGHNSVGGIIGSVSTASSLSYSYNTGIILGYQNIGGLIGKSSGTTIQSCYNASDVIGAGGYVGGIVGSSSSDIVRNAYNTGAVKGNNSVAGMAGQSFYSDFSSSYNAGFIIGNTFTAAFAGFNFDGVYTNSYYDYSNSNFTKGVGYPTDSDTTLVALNATQMLDTAFIDSLNYQSVWQIRNDSTYPALRGLDNAPFAINDTIYLSAKDVISPFNCNRFLQNDFDYETLQANLLLKVRTLSAGSTDSVLNIDISSMHNHDTIRVSYRLGESRIAMADTLWGNVARSLLVLDNHTPTLQTDSFSLLENTQLTFPILLNDIDGDVTSFVLIDSTQHGSLVVTTDSMLYTPDLDFSEMDSLRIKITDGVSEDSIWIKLNVIDVNEAPIARDTILPAVINTRLSIKAPVIDEDSTLDIQIYTVAHQGTVSIEADSIVYTSNLNAYGQDTVYWFALDSESVSSDTVRIVYVIEPQQLSVSSDTVYLDAYSNATDSIFVSSNTLWTVENYESWLSISQNSQTGSDSLSFVVADNPTAESREAVVRIQTTALAPIELYIIQRAKVQLRVESTIATSKQYDTTTDVAFTLGKMQNVADEDTLLLSLFATAAYDNAMAGENKTIRLHYTINGAAAGKYLAPIDTLISTAIIQAKQLFVTPSTVSISKLYDANPNAAISAGALVGVEASDIGMVALSATAKYDNANVGTNKTITVVYVLSGAAANNYLAPVDSVITSASIQALQLTLAAPTVELQKMYDAKTTATILALPNLQGVLNNDIASVNFSAEAKYDNELVGENKTIRVTYSLSGDAALNYIAPTDAVFNTASIKMWITLSPLANAVLDCGSAVLSVPYSVETGEPTQYRILFGNEAHTAGFQDISYTNLSTTNTNGVITIPVSNNKLFGNYKATLYMRNALNAESSGYPFTFNVKVPADLLIPKFDDVILVNNISNRFETYQWYKDGLAIEGANSQVYSDIAGLVGSYTAKLTSSEGEVFYTCPRVLNSAVRSASVLKVYPNPLNANQACNVILHAISKSDLVGARLLIIDSNAKIVFTSNKIETENSFTFANKTGAYVLRIELVDGRTFTQKIIVK